MGQPEDHPKWLPLVLGLSLVLGCARVSPPPPRAESRPLAPPRALPESKVAPPPACEEGALRQGDRACTLRQNEGRYAQQCAGGSWQETDRCRCAGLVKVFDPKLRAKIEKALSLGGPLDAERAGSVLELDLTSAGAASLEGLECFDALERLGLAQNQLRDLSPLSGLTKLEKLQISENRVLDLSPLRALTRLEELGMGSNCVSDLKPIEGMTELRILNATFNYVSSIAPLGGMTQLQHLFLSGNRFADLGPLARLYELRTLFIDSTGQRDVSALTELQRFDLIVIERNPLDCDAQAGNIQKLEENAQLHGGRVGHDCTELEIRRRREGRRDPLSTPVVKNKARDPRCARD